MGNIAKERESMEQADYPSYTLDALRARKETATIGNASSAPSRRERQSPDWRSEFRNLAFQSQLMRCHVSSPIGPIQRSILDGLAPEDAARCLIRHSSPRSCATFTPPLPRG